MPPGVLERVALIFFCVLYPFVSFNNHYSFVFTKRSSLFPLEIEQYSSVHSRSVFRKLEIKFVSYFSTCVHLLSFCGLCIYCDAVFLRRCTYRRSVNSEKCSTLLSWYGYVSNMSVYNLSHSSFTFYFVLDFLACFIDLSSTILCGLIRFNSDVNAALLTKQC